MNFKLLNIHTYNQTELFVNNTKKYRQVFEKSDLTYIYADCEIYNKLVDKANWEAEITFTLFKFNSARKKELCSLSSKHTILAENPTHTFTESWGISNSSAAAQNWWTKGKYMWQITINNTLVGTHLFWIEDFGAIEDEYNPYFYVNSLKLFKAPTLQQGLDSELYNTTFLKSFDWQETNFIFAHLYIGNLQSQANWMCEITFRFYNEHHFLKAEITEIQSIKEDEEKITFVVGCGSPDSQFWTVGNYLLEVLFMGIPISATTFSISYQDENGSNPVLNPLSNKNVLFQNTKTEKQRDVNNVMLQLNQLIGLHSIKKRIKDYYTYLQFLKLRIEKGLENTENINLHAVFTGNPGTGKTTVAKMLGEIYLNLGLLSKGTVHHVDRSDLVGEYIGQTAPKVKEALNEARGGILFIDEAYSLARSNADNQDFGREVIEILIKEISDGEKDIAIIVAGYPAEMNTFLNANPGLKSRFTQKFEFEDYTPDELLEIAQYTAEKQKIEFDTPALKLLQMHIIEQYRNRDKYFGNARYITQLISEIKIQFGIRIMEFKNPQTLDNQTLSTITPIDLNTTFESHKKTVPQLPIDEKQLQEALQDLNALTGINKVKKEINELIDLMRFYKENNEQQQLLKFSLHTVFVGNPGTGKTTVARILSRIFKALGILQRGHLIETDRQGLIANYIGQTATKTAEKIENAKGGTLFIDEAYALTPKTHNDFGQEAIETIIKQMEDQRGQWALIVAGYPNNMNQFLNTNPGLKSRFDRTLIFDDFNPTELTEVAKNKIAKENYTLEPDAEKNLNKHVQILHRNKSKNFGNARTILKLTELIFKYQNLRIAALKKQPNGHLATTDLKTITTADIQNAVNNTQTEDFSNLLPSLGFSKK